MKYSGVATLGDLLITSRTSTTSTKIGYVSTHNRQTGAVLEEQQLTSAAALGSHPDGGKYAVVVPTAPKLREYAGFPGNMITTNTIPATGVTSTFYVGDELWSGSSSSMFYHDTEADTRLSRGNIPLTQFSVTHTGRYFLALQTGGPLRVYSRSGSTYTEQRYITIGPGAVGYDWEEQQMMKITSAGSVTWYANSPLG